VVEPPAIGTRPIALDRTRSAVHDDPTTRRPRPAAFAGGPSSRASDPPGLPPTSIHQTHRRCALDATRRSALVAGVLYLVTFASSIPAYVLLLPLLDDPTWIVSAGADTQVRLGLVLDMVNAMACIGTAVALFTVLRRHHEGLALGFVTTRLLEAAIIAAGVAAAFAAVTLRDPGATGTQATALITTGSGLVAVRDWTFILGPGLMPAFNALAFGAVLYRFRLVPRWMPALGLVGAPLLLSSTTATALGINDAGTAWTAIATAPIFAWELSIGLWMTFKGFRPVPATAPDRTAQPGASVITVTTPAGMA
jgi:hypothetical protein